VLTLLFGRCRLLDFRILYIVLLRRILDLVGTLLFLPDWLAAFGRRRRPPCRFWLDFVRARGGIAAHAERRVAAGTADLLARGDGAAQRERRFTPGTFHARRAHGRSLSGEAIVPRSTPSAKSVSTARAEITSSKDR